MDMQKIQQPKSLSNTVTVQQSKCYLGEWVGTAIQLRVQQGESHREEACPDPARVGAEAPVATS